MGGGSSSNGGGSEAPNSLISDSLLKITDLLCHGPILGWARTSGLYANDPLTSTYFNDVVVRNLDGSYNFNISGQGFFFSSTLGTTGQPPMSGFEYVTCQVPLPPDTRLSNPPQNAGLPKSLYVTFNTNQYPDAASVLISYRIPEMYAVDGGGNINGFEIDVQSSISINGSPFTAMDLGDDFVGKNTVPYYRTYQYTLPKTTPPSSYYTWTIQMVKTSQDVQSAQVANDIYVDSVAVISASQYRYPNCVLAGLYCDANQFGTVPSRAYLIQGLLVSVPSGYTPTTYNDDGSITPAVYPDVWNGTFVTGVWTDNPAWIFYDFVTNPRYGLGQYINTANMDIWTLYQVSQYCDEMVDNGLGNGGLEPQFTCNVFIKDGDDAYNMLLNLASSFRGMLYYGNGTIRANLTNDKTPVFNYTNANVINGVFNYASTARSARHNAVQVKYTDVNNLYRDNYVLIEDNQGIIQYGYNKKEIAAFGCSSLGQATRVANWILTTERLRTETATFQVGFDGLYIRPGDVFNVYDNFRMNRNQGGRVMGFDPTQQYITLDRSVNLDSGCIYALTCLVPTYNLDATGSITGSNQIPLLRNPQIQSCEVLNGDVSGVSTLQVNGGFSGLMKNSIWILSATGVYTSGYIPTVFEQAPQYECLGVTQSSPGILDVVAVNYNTGINYTVNTGFSIIMNPINSGNSVAPLPVTNFTGQYITGALNNGSFYSYLNLTWSASLSSTVAGYTISGDPGGVADYSLIASTTSTGYRYINTVTGNVDFKVFAYGKGGALSSPQTFSFSFPGVPGVDKNQIRFWELPAGFGDLEQVAMFYNRPSPAVTNTNLFFATGFNTTFTQVLDTSFYPALGVSESGMSTSGTTVYFNSNSYDIASIVGQGAIQQANNSVLFLVDNELMSMGGFTGMESNQYAFSVSRGVLGTFPTVHSSNVSGWLFYSADISSFTNQSLVNVFNATGYDTGIATKYFQVQNNTATLEGAIVPPSPGISYTLPNPLPGVPTNLSGVVGTGKIVRLTWTAPVNDNIINYNVYRATAPSYSDRTGIGSDVNTHYDDINVNLGTTYEYWVTSVNQEEQESPFSLSVFETPQLLPSGINPYPPADPTGATLSSSGTYFAIDGTKLSFLAFNLPGLSSGAAYINLVYQKHAAGSLSGAQLGSQISAVGSQIATLYDLTPGVSYDVGTQAVSNYGLFSPDIVLVTNSPFTAPTGTVLPAAPTGLTASVGAFNGVNLNWQPNIEPDIDEYGIYRNTSNTFSLTNNIGFAAGTSYVDTQVAQGTLYYYWITAIDTSDNVSAPSTSVSATPFAISTGINQYVVPNAASAPTLTASGLSYASDGSLVSFLTFSIPALATNSAYQNLQYQKHGNSGALVGAQVFNSGVTSSATIFDLTTSGQYDVSLLSVSAFGIAATSSTYVANTPLTAPYIPSAPSTPQGFTASGGLGGTANFIALNWIPNTEIDLEEYGIYRNTVNSAPATPMALVSVNGYVDATVTGAVNYYYWLSAYNRSQIQSSLTSSITASTENPPSIPTAPTLNTSGTYYSSDGNTLSYLTFNMSPLPSGAVGQYLLYRLDGDINYTVGNDVNNVAMTTATLNDLTPGTMYDVAVQAYSLNGIATSVVAATNSPFTAPVISTPPNPPTSLSTNPASFTGMYTAPAVFSSSIIPGSTVPCPASILSWTPSTTSGLAYYEVTWNNAGPPGGTPPNTPVPLTPSSFASFTLKTVPPAVTQTSIYVDQVAAGFAYIRAVDKFGNASSWASVLNNNGGQYAGDMGAQSRTGINVVMMTGSTVNINSLTGNGAILNTLSGGSSTLNTLSVITEAISPSMAIGPLTARPVLVDYPLQYAMLITGTTSALANPFIQIPIPSSAGFTVKPDVCSTTLFGNIQNIVLTYVYADPDTTSTNAKMAINILNGGTIPTGLTITGSFDFIEYT